MTGAVMAEDASSLARLFRWCGVALIAAAMLIVVATVLHPSRETATTTMGAIARVESSEVSAALAPPAQRNRTLVALPFGRSCGSGAHSSGASAQGTTMSPSA